MSPITGSFPRNSSLGRDLLQRQAADGGKDSAAFIIDYNNKTLGVVQHQRYGYRQLAGDRTGLVWADFNSPPPPADVTPSPALPEYLAMADAFHETAHYLLLHNRKPREELPPPTRTGEPR